MPSPSPDRGHSPIPGESRVGLITMGVMLGLTLLGLIAAIIANAIVGGLEVTVFVLLGLFGFTLVAFVAFWIQRRNYRRDVAYGRVVEREPWSGGDLLPPG